MIQSATVIRLSNVCKIYGEGENKIVAVDNANLQINKGQFVAIMGPSGSGKSTLMTILGCLDVPTRGEYWFSGKNIEDLDDVELAHIRNKNIGFVFQQFNLLQKTSAWRNVELPLLYRAATNRRDKAINALDLVGLSSRIDHHPNQLSGGQQQRVAIARALVTDPDLILADEPTGNLDSTSAHDVLQLFNGLHQQGRTIILITHEPDVAAIAERTIHIFDGKLSEGTAA